MKISLSFFLSYKNTMDIEDLPTQKIAKYQVISASRREDIPAHRLHWFIRAIRRGYIEVKNPKSNLTHVVCLNPKEKNGPNVICWWSKDYKKWILHHQKHPHDFGQFVNYFNFTINSESSLEHLNSSLEERLKQLEWITKTFGAIAVNLRFDPIVFWKDINGEEHNNLKDFELIVSRASSLGINHVVFSFCIWFPQVAKNMKKCGKTPVNIPITRKHEILDDLLQIATKYGIILEACCSNNLVGYKGKNGGIVGSSACINGKIIAELLGNIKLRSKRKDPGQRKECNCVLSREVGDYDVGCKHGCEYCYAKPILQVE